MDKAISTLEEMASLEFQAQLGLARSKRKAGGRHSAHLSSEQQPWKDLCSSVPDLDALHLIGMAISASDSGFISLDTVREMVECAFLEHQQSCAWLVRPSILTSKLLRYLPVMMVTRGALVSGQKTAVHVAARPPDGAQFLQQIGSLVAEVNSIDAQVQQKLRALPIKSYLAVLETERDRRVFKGLVTQITNPTFVKAAFNWQHGSMSKITEDLDAIDCYVSDIYQLLQSVDYCNTTSSAVRKRLRKSAFVRLATNNFLGSRKRGGRPSKIRQFE